MSEIEQFFGCRGAVTADAMSRLKKGTKWTPEDPGRDDALKSTYDVPLSHPCGEKTLATTLCTWSPKEIVQTELLPSPTT